MAKIDFITRNTADRFGVLMLQNEKSCFQISVESGNGVAFEHTVDVFVGKGRAYAVEPEPYTSHGPEEFNGMVVIPESTPAIRVEKTVTGNNGDVEYLFRVERREGKHLSTLFNEHFYHTGDIDVDRVEEQFWECVNYATRNMEKVEF